MDKQQISSTAQEINSWIQDAVDDLAGYDYKSCLLQFSLDDKWTAKIHELIENGTNPDFINEVIADLLYNDVATLQDLTGDRIYDAGGGKWEHMILIAEEIRDCGASHESLRTAMNNHISRWKGHLKKMKGGESN